MSDLSGPRVTITAVEHGFSSGDKVLFNGVPYIVTQANLSEFVVRAPGFRGWIIYHLRRFVEWLKH